MTFFLFAVVSANREDLCIYTYGAVKHSNKEELRVKTDRNFFLHMPHMS